MQASTLLSQAPDSQHQLAASILFGQANATPFKITFEHLEHVAILEGKACETCFSEGGNCHWFPVSSHSQVEISTSVSLNLVLHANASAGISSIWVAFLEAQGAECIRENSGKMVHLPSTHKPSHFQLLVLFVHFYNFFIPRDLIKKDHQTIIHLF